MNALVPRADAASVQLERNDAATPKAYVTFALDEQRFGIAAHYVLHVARAQKAQPLPLAPNEVIGIVRQRGRIATIVDLRKRLGLPPTQASSAMQLMLECNGELCGLVVDAAGEIMTLNPAKWERAPANLSPEWYDVSSGIYRLESGLMILLDVPRLLRFE